MTEKKHPITVRYVVANPLGHPTGVPIIHLDGDAKRGEPDRFFLEGDAYDGPNAEAFRAEGLLVASEPDALGDDTQPIPEEPALNEGTGATGGFTVR